MGFQEILIIVLVAIVVLKPSEVPGFLYKLGKFFRQLRKLGHGVQGALNEVLSEGELEEIKSTAKKKVLAIESDKPAKGKRSSKKQLRHKRRK